MFEFYIAAREQKETGHPGIFSRQKHTWYLLPTKTQHHNICHLFIADLPVVCRNGVGWLVGMPGSYGHFG